MEGSGKTMSLKKGQAPQIVLDCIKAHQKKHWSQGLICYPLTLGVTFVQDPNHLPSPEERRIVKQIKNTMKAMRFDHHSTPAEEARALDKILSAYSEDKDLRLYKQAILDAQRAIQAQGAYDKVSGPAEALTPEQET